MGETTPKLPYKIRLPIPEDLVEFEPEGNDTAPALAAMREGLNESTEQTLAGTLDNPDGTKTREIHCWLEWNRETRRFEVVCEGGSGVREGDGE